jgi:hypothetical protein
MTHGHGSLSVEESLNEVVINLYWECINENETPRATRISIAFSSGNDNRKLTICVIPQLWGIRFWEERGYRSFWVFGELVEKAFKD